MRKYKMHARKKDNIDSSGLYTVTLICIINLEINIKGIRFKKNRKTTVPKKSKK